MEKALSKGPVPLSVESLSLPMTSVDNLHPLSPAYFYNVVSKVFGFNLKRISLPEGLTGKDKIPSYALQEFHNLPNGYYSVNYSEGYSTGFNRVMLGEMDRIRGNIARELADCNSVLDLGCGDGSSTRALFDQGIPNVWGLDPSPYLLSFAIGRNSMIKFAHGVAEATEFADESFDGIGACWVLHEVPSHICDAILDECHRILKPGGKVVFMEPSKHHFKESYFKLFKELGWRGVYFRFLASFAHEPFIHEWQGKNIKSWLEKHGFELLVNENNLPEEKIVARKVKR